MLYGGMVKKSWWKEKPQANLDFNAKELTNVTLNACVLKGTFTASGTVVLPLLQTNAAPTLNNAAQGAGVVRWTSGGETVSLVDVDDYNKSLQYNTAGSRTLYFKNIGGGTFTALIYGSLNLGDGSAIAGVLNFNGTTSGTVSVAVAAAAGTWTMTLPTAVPGTTGDQLSATTAGVCSWTAASSLRGYKDFLSETEWLRPRDALDRILNTVVPSWHYKMKADGTFMGTGDGETLYHGAVGEDAPWLMEHGGSKVSLVQTAGYMVLGFQAVGARMKTLEKELAELRKAVA